MKRSEVQLFLSNVFNSVSRVENHTRAVKKVYGLPSYNNRLSLVNWADLLTSLIFYKGGNYTILIKRINEPQFKILSNFLQSEILKRKERPIGLAIHLNMKHAIEYPNAKLPSITKSVIIPADVISRIISAVTEE